MEGLGTINTYNPLSALQMNSVDKGGTKDLAQAAREFESLLIGQILKSASESGSGGWMGTGEEDQAGLQAMSLATEQFAASLAAGGGLGLAKMVTASVAEQQKALPEPQSAK